MTACIFKDSKFKWINDTLDEIVPDGSRMIVPCNAEPPEIAPPGIVYMFHHVDLKVWSWSKQNMISTRIWPIKQIFFAF